MKKTRVSLFLTKNWFLLGILIVLLLGTLLPEAGAQLGTILGGTKPLVVLLFLISGFTLPTEAIKEGMKNTRLHIYIQGFIFLFTPLFFFLTTLPFIGLISKEVLIGIYALSCLPTTVSSCIVFSQISGGNTVGAIFNASLANIAGIFISPLLLSILLQGAGHSIPAEEALRIVRNLGLTMLLPVTVGQGLRIVTKNIASRMKGILKILSNIFILLIVLFSVSRTALDPAFVKNLSTMLLPFLYLALANIVLSFFAWKGAGLLGVEGEDRVTALFASSQKTMAVGVPLLSTYFASTPEILGIALLPLLFYHPWQLVVAGFIKNKFFPDPITNGIKDGEK